MFCQNCGAKNEDNSKFCAECGNVINNIGISQPYSDSVNMFSENNSGTSSSYIVPKKKVSPILLILVIAVFAVGIIIILNFIYGTDLSISDVKNGTLYNYPAAIGDAFEDYFDNCSWDAFTAEDDDAVSIVEFIGYMGSNNAGTIKVEIQFIHNSDFHQDDAFDISNIRLSSESTDQSIYLSSYETELFLDSIYYGETFEWSWQ